MIYRPHCKIVLLGKESTGKSCLLRRFTDNEYDANVFSATVGTSYAAKKVETSLGEIIISVWDTAGQERFDSLTKLYYNGASAALICIDLTDGSSYSKAQFWVKELRKYQPDCSCYIVLTKTDLLDAPKPGAAQRLSDATVSHSSPVERSTQSIPECLNNSKTALSTDANISKGPSAVDQKPSESPTTPLDTTLSSSNSERGPSTDGLGASWRSSFSSRQSFSSPRKKKEVADSQVKALAQTAGAPILRTSSATGEGVAELFQGVAEDLAPSITHEQDSSTHGISGDAHIMNAMIEEHIDPGTENIPVGKPKRNSSKNACCY